ncbi:hypothetical protein PHYPSEUDO_002782 [Phytophthora pseudosyringae]|uniref:FYVE-type domain-containing protein n=1 Tax=Phytophthora pseudosyringae TaxID=221518 RepID=A0A8T1VSV2_9STRA|nr:hypothetical protein PHYPSEUDO_002782 [Phytophthora pseudosyringae]
MHQGQPRTSASSPKCSHAIARSVPREYVLRVHEIRLRDETLPHDVAPFPQNSEREQDVLSSGRRREPSADTALASSVTPAPDLLPTLLATGNGHAGRRNPQHNTSAAFLPPYGPPTRRPKSPRQEQQDAAGIYPLGPPGHISKLGGTCQRESKRIESRRMAEPVRRATAPTAQDHAAIPALPRRATAPEDAGNRHRYTLLEATSSSPMPSPLTASVSSSNATLEPGNVEGFRHLAHSIVSRTLAVECEFDRMGRPEQDESTWKLLKKQNRLRVYKRKAQQLAATLDQSRVGASSSKKPPMIICVGSVEGTVEDILYGMHAKTRSELGATMTFMDRSPLDCDVLAVLDGGSTQDPFRQLSIKYLLAETFGDARVVNDRDVCSLESMGFGHDARGKRYGYYLLRSVDLPECSPLPEDSGVVRASVTMCCIYRQAHGSVKMYSKAMVDLGGSLPGFLAYDAATELLLSSTEAIASATAKRLTVLALRNYHSRKDQEPEDLTSSSESELLLSSSRYARSFNFRSTKSVTTMAPSHTDEERSTSTTAQKMPIKPCSVCGKKPKMAKLVRSTHRNCGVCNLYVCTKCSVKQKLYARADAPPVACCKVCLLAAKQLKVDPRDPFPMLP